MSTFEPTPPDPSLLTRRSSDDLSPDDALYVLRRRIFLRTALTLTALTLILAVAGFFLGRHWVRQAMRDSLPQLDGALSLPGLTAPVTIQRDAHGVPHLRAASLDDLVIAQGFVTTQDRLWQMDVLRRHAAGELAEILGPTLISHDRIQRTLRLRASADRAFATLPPDQLHWLELYARGVNASIASQLPHLPLEFRLLRYEPTPWTPRDSLLVGLVMFQDLTNSFPQKLNREALTARLPSDLIGDLYPVGSWRDHSPAQPVVDLTSPQTDIPDVPLDESQTRLSLPKTHGPSPNGITPASATAPRATTPGATTPGAPSSARLRWASAPRANLTPPPSPTEPTPTQNLLALQRTLSPALACEDCRPGSNNWVVSGAHTATGKPLLSNDMHLTHNVPGVWYEADLESSSPTGEFHVTGVSLPGVPFIIVGHNAHIAWGFTNLGADVQDVYIEHTRGAGDTTEYQTADSTWQPLLHQQETIHVKGSKDVLLDVLATRHGDDVTPIISGLASTTITGSAAEPDKRTLSLRWTIYDPATITPSFLAINSASDWPTLTAAFSTFGGPAQNLVYADDQGHIGYHAFGKIPLRGSSTQPTPISPVPVDALDPAQQWAGYIPFDQLPLSFDPPNGILATANARITPDGYPFPITLNWAAPYRNERIWKVLAASEHLTSADMLRLQTDVYSDVDHVIAQRLAYAIDHAASSVSRDKRLHQAADLLRSWNGNVDTDATAPAIVDAARTVLWPLLLDPHLGPKPGDAAQLYTWGEKSYAQEWLILHTPSRWLPPNYATWDDLLATAVDKGLREAHAPFDLSKWHYGRSHFVAIEHPVYSQSPLLQRLIGSSYPTGTGSQPQSGDATTVKQVGRTFGPSERFTADLADLDHSTLNIVLGQSANPASPWFMDQWPAWFKGTTYLLPFTKAATDAATTHTLTLTPH